VPLVVGPDGQRLAKRDGAITLADLARGGLGAEAVRSALAVTLGIAAPGERVAAAELVSRFDLATIVATADGPVRYADVLAAAEQAR
jgi:glutamyl-tRNA synthetase